MSDSMNTDIAETDVTKAVETAVEAAPEIASGVSTVMADVNSGDNLAAASQAAAAAASTMDVVANSGNVGGNDSKHLSIFAELSMLLSQALKAIESL